MKNEPEAATALKPGQYQADWKVASLRSVDKTTPATNLKQGATGRTTACVTDQIDPALFAEDGDSCTIANPYVRNGRLQMDLTCTRKGQDGQVRQSVSGNLHRRQHRRGSQHVDLSLRGRRLCHEPELHGEAAR